MLKKMRVIIIEDHELERKYLKDRLSLHPDIDLIGEFSDTESAWPLIETGNFDGILIDIGIHTESDRAGMDLAIRIDRLNFISPPWIIFITGLYERFAEEAHEVRPYGFMRKPFSDGDLARKLDKIRKDYQANALTHSIEKIEINYWTEIRDAYGEIDKIKNTRYVTEDEIVSIEAINGCGTVKLQLSRGEPIVGVRMTIRDCKANPNLPNLFLSHRSHLVNVCFVSGVKNDLYRDEGYSAMIRGSSLEIPVTKEHLNDLRNAIAKCSKNLSMKKKDK